MVHAFQLEEGFHLFQGIRLQLDFHAGLFRAEAGRQEVKAASLPLSVPVWCSDGERTETLRVCIGVFGGISLCTRDAKMCIRDSFTGVEEWLFGRGMDGTYRSPSVAELDTMNRRGIETGYLNIILHGGLFLLFPYIIILLYSGNMSSTIENLSLIIAKVPVKNGFGRDFG